MSFSLDNLNSLGARGMTYEHAKMFCYQSDTDTLQEMKAPGYFDEISQSPDDKYLIIANASDRVDFLRLQSVDGQLQVVDHVVYDDYLVPALSLAGGSNAPTRKVFRGSLEQLAFAGTGPTTEEAFFVVHLLHGLKEGSDMTFHTHWGHIIGSPSGNVKWQIDYSIARGYGVGAFAAPSSLSTVRPVLAQYVHDISDDDDMTVVNSVEVEPDSLILGRIYRDPGDAEDTFENDAYLFHIDLHYQRGQVGTTERNRPWTSAGYS